MEEKQKSHNKQCGQLDQAEQDNQEPPVLDQYDGDPSDSELITKWFTDKDVCLSDFEDSYDEDYVDETTAEGAAEAFLSNEGIPDWIEIDIVELIDRNLVRGNSERNNRFDMTRNELLFKATIFRRAIEKAKSAGDVCA